MQRSAAGCAPSCPSLSSTLHVAITATWSRARPRACHVTPPPPVTSDGKMCAGFPYKVPLGVTASRFYSNGTILLMSAIKTGHVRDMYVIGVLSPPPPVGLEKKEPACPSESSPAHAELQQGVPL